MKDQTSVKKSIKDLSWGEFGKNFSGNWPLRSLLRGVRKFNSGDPGTRRRRHLFISRFFHSGLIDLVAIEGFGVYWSRGYIRRTEIESQLALFNQQKIASKVFCEIPIPLCGPFNLKKYFEIISRLPEVKKEKVINFDARVNFDASNLYVQELKSEEGICRHFEQKVWQTIHSFSLDEIEKISLCELENGKYIFVVTP